MNIAGSDFQADPAGTIDRMLVVMLRRQFAPEGTILADYEVDALVRQSVDIDLERERLRQTLIVTLRAAGCALADEWGSHPQAGAAAPVLH